MRLRPFLLGWATHVAVLVVFWTAKRYIDRYEVVETQSCLRQVDISLQAISKLEAACEQCASERAHCAYTENPPRTSEGEQAEYPDPRKAVPLYRAYSRNFKDHLFTTNDAWVDEHVRDFDHIRQGVAAYIFPTPETNTKPLYQLYRPSWHDHFYTTSLAEREDALSHGYHNEGIAGYVFLSPASGGKPLYRLYSGGRKDHLYTVSEGERNQAMGRGYSDEGIVGYVYPGSPL